MVLSIFLHQILTDFYQRGNTAIYASAGIFYGRDARSSVCPSVRLSHSSTVSKRTKRHN